MNSFDQVQQLPVYSLVPDKLTGNKDFRVYNFDGNLPDEADLLLPHRKNHYLIVLIREGGTRQWLDMTPYTLKSNTMYFYVPNRIIVKEGTEALWATGISFTKEFLSLQENASLLKLPIIESRLGGHELSLEPTDLVFVEDILAKINLEYSKPGEWQQRMLTAYLTVLLTYLSRLYVEQYKSVDTSAEKMLLKAFSRRLTNLLKS